MRTTEPNFSRVVGDIVNAATKSERTLPAGAGKSLRTWGTDYAAVTFSA